jgi:hypothetical protein
MSDLFDWMGRRNVRTRADQIFAAFETFHRMNPYIWKLFLRFTQEVIDAGFVHYSVNAVFERIRWHVSIETKSEDGFKLNNVFRAYYARLFEVGNPQYRGLFRKRKLTSADRPPYQEESPPFVEPPPPDDDRGLTEKLRGLL